ncbi:MAG: transposase [Bacteroidales bacterium]|nr:transposase [Bacteroidales bacterium]
MSKRRKFTSAFKQKVVIEALKERLTLSELAQKYELHSNVIKNWKKEFLEKSQDLFDKPGKKRERKTNEDELYRQIGKLKVENEFLKKNLDPYL